MTAWSSLTDAIQEPGWPDGAVEVVVERPAKKGDRGTDPSFFARTDAYRPVIVSASAGVTPGALVEVTINEASPSSLFARAQG